MPKFEGLHKKVTRARIHNQQRTVNLINGYIKDHERRLKLTPTNFIYYVVLRFHQGKEPVSYTHLTLPTSYAV